MGGRSGAQYSGLTNSNTTAPAGVNGLFMALIALVGLSSPYVLMEPAPYDIFLILLCAIGFGYVFHRQVLPVATLGLIHFVFVLIAVLNYSLLSGGVDSHTKSELATFINKYIATQAYFTLSFVILYAMCKASELIRREIVKWLVYGAALSAILVILLHFSLSPATIYRDEWGVRVQGFFEDPNVLGPYLILPATYVLFSRNYPLPQKAMLALPMIGLLVLTYSRAAMVGMLISVILILSVELTFKASLRSSQIKLLTIISGCVLLLVAFPFLFDKIFSTDSYTLERLRLQDYDSHRFENVARALREGLSNPFGLGPGVYGHTYGSNPHNLYVGRLTDAGLIPTAITIIALFAAAYRSLKSAINTANYLSLCIFASLSAHIIISMVVHSHHWRHFLLLIVLGLTAPLFSQNPKAAPLGLRE